MDTIVFALILVAALLVIFVKKRWIIILGYTVAFVATALLFSHHVTTTLDLSF